MVTVADLMSPNYRHGGFLARPKQTWKLTQVQQPKSLESLGASTKYRHLKLSDDNEKFNMKVNAATATNIEEEEDLEGAEGAEGAVEETHRDSDNDDEEEAEQQEPQEDDLPIIASHLNSAFAMVFYKRLHMVDV